MRLKDEYRKWLLRAIVVLTALVVTQVLMKSFFIARESAQTELRMENSPDEIRPADVFTKVLDVYDAVIWLSRLVGILCALVVTQIIAKSIIYARIVRVLYRVEHLIDLVERHGALTDNRAEELKAETHKVAKKVAAVVQVEGAKTRVEVPARIIEKIDRDANSKSGTELPTVPEPKPGQ